MPNTPPVRPRPPLTGVLLKGAACMPLSRAGSDAERDKSSGGVERLVRPSSLGREAAKEERGSVRSEGVRVLVCWVLVCWVLVCGRVLMCGRQLQNACVCGRVLVCWGL